MRHRKKFNHLGRKSAHRQETLSSMATALILHKRINTTLAKAKALRVYVEPLITKSKVDSTHSRRTVFSYLGNKNAVSELFREVAQKVAERPGGYTRILKTGFRKGDSAEMCFIELVDYNANMLSTEEDTKQKTTRRGRGRKTATTATPNKAKETSVGTSTVDQDASSVSEVAEVPKETAAEVAGPTAEPVEDVVSEAVEEQGTEKVEESESKSESEVIDSTATEEKPNSKDQSKDSEEETKK